MRKRLVLVLLVCLSLAGTASACKTGLKAGNREAYGTPTRTPFLVKATFTSVSPPLEMAGGAELNDPFFTAVVEPTSLEEASEDGEAAGASPTPSSTPTPKDELPETSAGSSTPKSTATPKPTKLPPTAVPTKPPATSTPTQTPADTDPPAPPADTNTPKPPTSTPTPTATDPPGECVYSGNSSYESQVITLINQERTERGLTALVQNSSLTLAARRHSEDMACNDNWSHTGTDGSTLSTRILAAGYSYSWAAENIAASSSQYFSPQSVVNMWMNSDGHRANILSPNAVHIGVGFRYAGDVDLLPYDAYYTADFGRP